MKKRKSILESMKAAATVGAGLSHDAAEVEERRDRDFRRGTTRALADIRPRPGGDTRALDPGHVVDLAESIAAVGLVEPIAVDRRGHLLAGGHRCAALRILAASDRAGAAAAIMGPVPADLLERLAALPEGIIDAAAVPVSVLDFDAEKDPTRALAVEVAENEKRRDYSRAEVRELADRLRRAGFRDKVGRPKPGEKALAPALALIVGKSLRSMRRALAGEMVTPDTITDPAAAAAVALGRAIGRYLEATRGDRRRVHQRLSTALRGIAEDVEAAADGAGDE